MTLYLYFSFLLLAVPLLIALPYSAFLLVHSKTKIGLIFPICVVVCYLASLNSSKVYESDLLFYSIYFAESKAVDIWDVVSIAKEPVYFILNYVGNFTGITFPIFIYFITFFVYSSLMLPIIEIGRDFKISNLILFFLGLTYLLFPLFFIQVGHLIRQYLAAAFALVYVTRLISSDKGSFWLLLAIGTHFTAIIFLIIPLIERVRPKILTVHRLDKLVITTVLIIGFVVALPVLASLISAITPIGYLKYILVRLSQTQYYDLEPVSYTITIINFLILFSNCAAANMLHKRDVSSIDAQQHNKRLSKYYWLLNSLTILSLLPLIFQLLGHPEPALRLFQYALITSVFSILIILTRVRNATTFILVISSLTVISFMVYPNSWTYHLEPNILVPVALLF